MSFLLKAYPKLSIRLMRTKAARELSYSNMYLYNYCFNVIIDTNELEINHVTGKGIWHRYDSHKILYNCRLNYTNHKCFFFTDDISSEGKNIYKIMKYLYKNLLC